MISQTFRLLGIAAMGFVVATSALAQFCPEQPPSQVFTGAGSVACPCFVPGEEAGTVFTIPAEHFPIEILRVGVGWGSLFGANPPTVEQAVHLYNGQLPDPGPRIYSLYGPQLADGAINEFDLELEPGEIVVDAGPVSATLEFMNQNASNIYASTVVHDGNGCTPGANLLKTVPGGWFDACSQGVTGDWVFHIVYREVNCLSGVADEHVAGALPAAVLHPCFPNPFNPSTAIAFDLPQAGPAELAIYTTEGRRVRTLVDGEMSSGRHEIRWEGRDDQGHPLPSGVYLYQLRTAFTQKTQRMVLLK